MGSVQTGIEMQDQFSSVLMSFINNMTAAVTAANSFSDVMNQNINTSGLSGVRSEIQSVAEELNALNQSTATPISPIVSAEVQQIEVPGNLEVPVTPVVTEQPQIDIPMQVQSVQQFNEQIEQTQGLLQRVSNIQQVINSESQNMGVLPDDVQVKIQEVNNSILEMQAAMDQVSQNPFNMPTEAIEAELASLQSRIRETVQEQLELNETLSNMDIEIEQPPPVQIPVEWQTDNLDVFISTGVERFSQEIQSANTMLEQLSDTQNEIARQALHTDILPPSAVQDMNALAVRIDNVRGRIQQIENNPMNLGTDQANSGLEQLRSQLDQAVAQQNEMNSAIDRMDVQSANSAYLQLSQTIGNTESYIRDNVNEQGAFNEAINEGTENANNLIGTIKGAVAAYATINTAKSALNMSDELAQTTSRLNLMNDEAQSTAELVNMAYTAAQNARGEFSAMASAVARFGNNAKGVFGSSTEVVQFAELVQKQMTVAGATTQEASNAMLQLTQALGSGVLRGDELNSIFEQAPNMIQNIADYLNVPRGEIREMAADGEISADIVKGAIFAATDEINASFESMPMTWGQAWASMQNTAMMAFQPVLQRLNQIANSEQFEALTTNVINAMALVAGIVLQVFGAMGAAGQFVVEHWSVLSPIIYTVVGALAAYAAYLGIVKAIEIISTGIKMAMCIAEYAHAASTGTAVAATTAYTAAQLGLNTALLACPVTWIILAIIALIAIVIAVTSYIAKMGTTATTTFGVICGAAATAGALFLNTAIGIINAILQEVWAAAEPLIGIIEWVLNVANGGFDSFGGAVANLIGQIISWFLSLGKIVTRIIDAIFGTDWTAGLSSLQDTVLSWGKNDNAITLDRGAPAIDYRVSYDDAYRAGAKWGDDISDKVSRAVKNIKTDMPNAGDYPNAVANAGNTATSVAIAKNTGDTAKAAQKAVQSLDITGENLKYIKDMAERDYINRFTTAQITVNQTNHNNVNKNMDLDGINEYLRSDLEQRMAATAEGVH